MELVVKKRGKTLYCLAALMIVAMIHLTIFVTAISASEQSLPPLTQADYVIGTLQAIFTLMGFVAYIIALAFLFNFRGMRTSSRSREDEKGKIIGRIVGSLAAISIVLYIRNLFPSLGPDYSPEQQGARAAEFYTAVALEAPGDYLLVGWITRLIARLLLPKRKVESNDDTPRVLSDQSNENEKSQQHNNNIDYSDTYICEDCGYSIRKKDFDSNAELFCPDCNGRLQD